MIVNTAERTKRLMMITMTQTILVVLLGGCRQRRMPRGAPKQNLFFQKKANSPHDPGLELTLVPVPFPWIG